MKNIITMLIILLSIFTISIGYSALNVSLTVSGTAYVDRAPGIRIISNEVSKASSSYETYSSQFTDTTITNYTTTEYGTSKMEYKIGIENSSDIKYFIADILVLIDDNPNMVYTTKGLSNFQEINAGETIYFNLIVSPSGYYNLQSEVLSLEFVFTESYQFNDEILNGADPELVYGLVPINLGNDGSVTKADINSNWYDYLESKWANAVIVKEEVREYYADASPNTDINLDDILGYYVWIPRFEYKVFNTTNEAVEKVSTSIRFVSKDAEVLSSTTLGTYTTHTAFTYNGQPLSGIWVGKFETTGTSTNPTVLPNQTSLKNTVSELFKINIKFSGGIYNNDSLIEYESNAYYGLTASSESRMLKESEWGAIALLSNSIYGSDSTVWNNSYTLTGCGASTENQANSSSCVNGYGTINNGKYAQSTTGNIYGVFDMAGGIWEYTMGTYEMSTSSSGFTSQWLINNQKFYDIISSNYMNNLGFAIDETKGWDSDLFVPPTSGIPWSIRGYNNAGGNASGIFATGNTRGNSTQNASRNVLINVPILS